MTALYITTIILFWVIVGLIKGIQLLLEWRKSGYCRHDFRIYNTNSFGPHWYKCDKCGEKRLK